MSRAMRPMLTQAAAARIASALLKKDWPDVRAMTAQFPEQAMYFRSQTVSDEGAEAMGEGLKENKVLRTLCITHCEFGPAGALRIVEALPSCKALRELELKYETLGTAAVDALAAYLRRDQQLEVLQLEDAGVGDAGAARIANAIGENARSALRSVSLIKEGVGVAGAEAFGRLLEGDSRIEKLCLAQNVLSAAGVRAVARGVAVSSRLRELVLSGCKLDEQSGTDVAKALEINCSVEKCYVIFNFDMPKALHDRIAAATAANGDSAKVVAKQQRAAAEIARLRAEVAAERKARAEAEEAKARREEEDKQQAEAATREAAAASSAAVAMLHPREWGVGEVQLWLRQLKAESGDDSFDERQVRVAGKLLLRATVASLERLVGNPVSAENIAESLRRLADERGRDASQAAASASARAAAPPAAADPADQYESVGVSMYIVI